MAINEFRWGVKPSIPGHWRDTLRHNGFDVAIAGDWIELRKEEEGERDAQEIRAQQIVNAIIRKIGLAEKTRFTAKMAGVARFDPHSNHRDITVLLSDSVGLTMSGHADVLVTAADGTIVSDSRKDRMTELLMFANTWAMSDMLGRMSDYLLDYYGDPEKKLAPLYDIIELATEVFGHEHKAATSLGIGIRKMKHATGVMNDESIRSGRHRGQELGPQREPNQAEVQLCETVAEQIVSEYANLVQHGAAPK
jgi:hypothetical protein